MKKKQQKPETKSQFKQKSDVSLEPALMELRRIYSSSVSRLGNLASKPIPMIIIQSRGRKRILGWFAAESWEKPGAGKPFNELTIAAESLGRSTEEIAATFLGLMVESALHHEGIRAVRNGYHNQKFKVAAESIGLIVEKDERLGWCRISLSPELRNFVSSLNLKDEAFEVFRLAPPDRAKQPTKMKKWACSCPVIVRCAVQLSSHCDECAGPFEWAESEPNPWADQRAADMNLNEKLTGKDPAEKPQKKIRKGKRTSPAETEVRQ